MWSEFSVPTQDEWTTLVAKEAGGKTAEQLASRSWEGLNYAACCEAALATSASGGPAQQLEYCELQPDQKPSQIQARSVLRGPLGLPALIALANRHAEVQAVEIDLWQFLQQPDYACLHQARTDLEIRFSSQAWVQQGADAVHELAWSFAGFLEILEQLESPPPGPLALKLSASPRLLLEIARWRAARQLWDTVCQGFSLNWPARIHLVQDARFLTHQDPHNNLLRSTVAATAGLLGGAASIELLPCNSSPDALRWADNVLHLLRDEARLGRETDPLAGSGLLEDLTQQLAEAAWKETLRVGRISEQTELWALARDQRLGYEDQLRRDRQGLVGVNRYVANADFAGDPPQLTYASATPVSYAEARQIFDEDKALHHTGLLPPLEKLRWSEAFEEAFRRGQGKKLDVLVLGKPTPELKGRQGYVRTWLAMAGIEARFQILETPESFVAPSMWMLCCEDAAEGEPDYKVTMKPPALVGKAPHNYQGVAVHHGCNRVYCLEQLLDLMP